MAQKLASAGLELSNIIKQLTIRDWKRNDDVQKQMKNEVEDFLLSKRTALGIEISFQQLDLILDDVMKVAIKVF